jgi:Nuclease-related domain
MLGRREPQAGGYAQRRYRRGLRKWRARILLICAAILGPPFVLGIAGLVVWGHPLLWSAGALAGTAMALWMAFWDTPPSFIEHWRMGAEGERATEKAIRRLERVGWRAYHDVQRRYGNYDHIAVGRAGVFLLETKKLSGSVELRDGVLHQTHQLDPDYEGRWEKILPRARANAAQLKEEIEGQSGRRIWVQVVVVLWSDFPAGIVEEGRCVFVHGSELAEWLQGRPPRLSRDTFEDIAAAVAHIANEELTVVRPEISQPDRASPGGSLALPAGLTFPSRQ